MAALGLPLSCAYCALMSSSAVLRLAAANTSTGLVCAAAGIALPAPSTNIATTIHRANRRPVIFIPCALVIFLRIYRKREAVANHGRPNCRSRRVGLDSKDTCRRAPMKIPMIAVAGIVHAAACGAAAAQSPYAGLEARPVKALSDEQIADLKAGRGMGLALAAELNGYPGPRHLLDLADQLSLTPAQRAEVQRLFDAMAAE